MKGGVLEVLLVNAEDLHHSHLMGSSGIYVVLRCGDQIQRSKLSKGNDGMICWNEKFFFSFATREWNSLTRLRMKIMKSHALSEDSPIGETTIHLGGVLDEGNRRGGIDLNAAPYNVVLPDGAYQGQIKIGFKFTYDVRIDELKEKSAKTSQKRRKLVEFLPFLADRSAADEEQNRGRSRGRRGEAQGDIRRSSPACLGTALVAENSLLLERQEFK
ncbi:calcium-dependent lipid-binding (CaLB domain) family protein isoform X1 [Wolffia australiana]